MIAVSNGWKEMHKKRLLPESFIEISVGVGDTGVHNLVTVDATNEAVFSNTQRVVRNVSSVVPANYATLETNLWSLDGSRNIMPDSEPYDTPAYVSSDDSEITLTLTLSEVRENPIPGFTIDWSSEFGEYPTTFTIVVKSGDAVVGSVTVENNKSSRTAVDMPLTIYDRVDITMSDWINPDRRKRVDLVTFGHLLTFDKASKRSSIMSFSHEQHGDLNSGELPKNSIEFALDNTDGRWNPSNPTGDGKYLSERQVVTAKYGLMVNGVKEWISAGRWYLSEWRAPSNGMEGYFVARDVFEYMLNTPYTGILTGTLGELVRSALSLAELPEDSVVNVDSCLDDYTATLKSDHKYTVAEVIQLCANAGKCVIWQDRSGALNIAPLNTTLSEYTITSLESYVHPELELSKPMKAVSVDYGDPDVGSKYVLNVNESGETQTVENPLVVTEAQATEIAEWVRDTHGSRKTIKGDFRADPRLDLFDVITVESKYGTISPVAITNIKYNYTGSFRASYTGRVIKG